MNIWLEGNQRCCDRETAIELGGSEYKDTSIKTILHFDEYIRIVDNEKMCHGDTLGENEELIDKLLDKATEHFRNNPEEIVMGSSGSGAAFRPHICDMKNKKQC